VTINVPLQVGLTRQNPDCVVVGGVDGAVVYMFPGYFYVRQGGNGMYKDGLQLSEI
jgi:hypothetical protein